MPAPAGSAPTLEPEFALQMVDAVGAGVGIYGADGHYTYVNQAYAALFDATPTALTGQPLWEIVPALEADRFDRYWDSFENGETRTAETIHRCNGREVPVATVTTQQPIDGTPYHFGTITDITERKARERELERQNERLENFTNVVSHDLRNPLNVAQGYLELLDADIDRDELHLVANALDRMEVLITELLELAQAGAGDGESEPVSLATVAEAAWRTVATPEATLDTPAATHAVIADASRLQQLFENLFRNAIEHAGPAVRVTVAPISDGFAVSDDGPGIPPDARDTVFETGYTTADSGTGFGLSIVQQIANEQGWEIRVTDAPDGGARFEITGVDIDPSPDRR